MWRKGLARGGGHASGYGSFWVIFLNFQFSLIKRQTADPGTASLVTSGKGQ